MEKKRVLIVGAGPAGLTAAYELVKSMNPKKVYINFICDLEVLNGRSVFPPEVEVTSLFTF